MKGFRTFVLQDLPHVLPSKVLQNQFVSNCQSSSAHVHTSASSRRFWNLFEFTAKEEICSDANKCLPANDAAAPSMITDLDGAPRNISSNAAYTPAVPFGPKNYGYMFDLKSTPMSCTRVSQPLQRDNLMSLLDGNPVPKTLKWKLKGYRTLRNEQAGDFAFVPGTRSNDRDVISKNERTEATNDAEPTGRVAARSEELESVTTVAVVDRTEASPLTNEIVKHGEELSGDSPKTYPSPTIAAANEISGQEATNGPVEPAEDAKAPVVCSGQKVATLPKLLASSIPMNEDIKFLPVSKSELSANQLKYQTQPAAQYSSRPPKRFSKPSAPMLRRTAGNRSATDVGRYAPPMESYREDRVAESQESRRADAAPEALAPGRAETVEEVEGEWSSMEARDSDRYTEQQLPEDRDRNVAQLSANPGTAEQEMPLHLSEPLEGPRDGEPSSMEPRWTVEDENMANREERYDQRRPDAYFAPRPKKYAGRSTRPTDQSFYSRQGRTDYESIAGLPPRQHPVLNISHPGTSQQRIKSSPCAASHARLLEGTGIKAPGNGQQAATFGGGMPSGHSGGGGGGGGGPKKPPGSLPPFSVRRSSSKSCCPLKRIVPPKGAVDAPRRGLNSVNPSSNISTSSVDAAARRCGDDDSNRCKNRGRSCKPQRKCEEERPKCKKEKKVCQRYCCPALHSRQVCDFAQFQCPNGDSVPPLKTRKDPTCMPDEAQDSRSICTSPSSKKRPERSCRRERSCGREREQSCDRGCQRRRPCRRQEPACPQQQDQGREICTKPRKREDSCKRDRKCGDRGCNNRSTNCSGRRHYTHSARVRGSRLARNVKRYSSLPAFAFPLIGAKTGAESMQRLKEATRDNGRNGGHAKSSTCKYSKIEDKCKSDSKKDPCKAVMGSCGKKKEDHCKKASQTSCSQPKKDSCGKGKGKAEDFCAKRREELCKERKSALSKSSDGESVDDRVKRERKEMEECKKGGAEKQEKAKKKASGLERVVSPCKQKQSKDKGSKCKFTSIDVPYNCFANTMSTVALRQDGYKNTFPNIATDRSYSTRVNQEFNSEQDTESHVNAQFWDFQDDNYNIDVAAVPKPVEEHAQTPYSHTNYSSNWLLSWFHGNQD